MNRMTVYDQMRQCFKVTPHQEPGRSVIQELGIYEDIHEVEIKKARNITDIRDLYFTKGAKLDPYWYNFGKEKAAPDNWIPVTERLPEKHGDYLVTIENGDVFNCYFNSDYCYDGYDNGAFTYTQEYFDHETMGSLGSEEFVVDDVVAWMSYEPYKAESEVEI